MNPNEMRKWWKVAMRVANQFHNLREKESLNGETNRIRDSGKRIEVLLRRFKLASKRNWKAAQSLAVNDCRQTIDLGSFRIELHLKSLSPGSQAYYEVIATEANRPSVNEDVTHPHVQNDRLCEGDAQPAIKMALGQGRLLDFVQLVEQVLRTFRDSTLSNMTAFFSRFRELNVRSNDQLDDLVIRCEQLVSGVQPQSLRDSDSLRRSLSTNLASVQSSLDQLMVERPRRNIIRPARPSDSEE